MPQTIFERGDSETNWPISRDIALEEMSFTFRGQKIAGERLAKLLGIGIESDEPVIVEP